MTSLVFRNFYFDYYSYRFGLGFRLGLGLGLRVSFFSLYYKMFARTERAPSLFLLFKHTLFLYLLSTWYTVYRTFFFLFQTQVAGINSMKQGP